MMAPADLARRLLALDLKRIAVSASLVPAPGQPAARPRGGGTPLYPVGGMWDKLTAAARAALDTGTPEIVVVTDTQEVPPEYANHHRLRVIRAATLRAVSQAQPEHATVILPLLPKTEKTTTSSASPTQGESPICESLVATPENLDDLLRQLQDDDEPTRTNAAREIAAQSNWRRVPQEPSKRASPGAVWTWKTIEELSSLDS